MEAVAWVTLLLVVATVALVVVTWFLVREADKDREERLQPFVAVTRAWAQSNWDGNKLSETIVCIRVRNVKHEPALHVEATLVKPVRVTVSLGNWFLPTSDRLRVLPSGFNLEDAWDLTVGYFKDKHDMDVLKNLTLQVIFRGVNARWWKATVPLSLAEHSKSDILKKKSPEQVWPDIEVDDSQYKLVQGKESDLVTRKFSKTNIYHLKKTQDGDTNILPDLSEKDPHVSSGRQWKGPIGRQKKSHNE